MQRARRKRKFNNSEKDVLRRKEEEALQIKSEPVDDLPMTEVCCLCKTSSGVKLSPIYEESSEGVDSTTIDKIKICIGQEMSPETDPAARICHSCLQELESHHSYWKQALQCNDYAQNQMAADETELIDAPEEIRVCRFCLKIGGNLLELFPKGEPSNEHQLEKIRECLAIQMNSWDPVTKICQTCVHRVQQFLDFQEKHVPATMFLKAEPLASSSYPSNEMLQGKAQQKDLDLDLGVSNSDCSVELANVRNKSLSGVKLGAIQPELVELLGIDSKRRNFSVVLKNGEQLKVAFKDYLFRFHTMSKHSGSLWYCLEAKLMKCPVKLEIDPEGEIASITSKCSTHVHPVQPPKLMECPIGKGFVQFGGNSEPFWLLNSQPIFNNQARGLIHAGYPYFLHLCNKYSPLSIWHCGKRGKRLCKAVLEVEGIFQRVKMSGIHNHAALEPEELDVILKACPVDLATTEAISEFQKNNQVQKVLRAELQSKIKKHQQQQAIKSVLKEKNPDIFKVLQEEDSERNFECVNAGPKLKIKHKGFEYRYFGTQEDESTLWKCIMDSLHHCAMIAKLSWNGKRLEMFKGSRHSHPTEPAAVFGYPLGKRMIGSDSLWMIKRVQTYYESRSLIYRDYVFILQDVNKKGKSRWCCLRKHCCRASLTVDGDFVNVHLAKGHSHEKTSEEILSKFLESPQPLSPDENLTFKQRLLSLPSMVGQIWNEVENESETYMLNKMNNGGTVRNGLIFRRYKYSFTSVDQHGTSRWTCMKQDTCRAFAIVEGIYETIYIKDEHAHEMMSDSEIDLMMQRSTNKVRSEAPGGNLVQYSANSFESKTVLSILARHDPDRNFSVSRMKIKLLIHFDQENFRIRISNTDGTSLWFCTWLRLRNCPVTVKLSADGKQAISVNSKLKHNHSEEEIALFYLTLGKAPVYDADIGANRFYWLFSIPSEYITNRAIIYQGYRYCLRLIRNIGASTWQCYVKNCRAFAHVEDCLKKISCKNEHNHDPLPNEEILALTGLTEVDEDLLRDSRNLAADFVPSTKGPIRPETLFKFLSTNDSDRNFQVLIKTDKMKILQDGYEYTYQSSNATHTVWKCFYYYVRHCRAVLHIDNRCKQGFLPQFPKHSHQSGLWGIFKYPQGESTIMDSNTQTIKPFWYRRQSGFLRPYPILIYDQNKFRLTFITERKDSSRWRCSVSGCPVALTVTGQFELIVATGSPHNHELPSEKKVAIWKQTLGGNAGEVDDADVDFDNQKSYVEVPMSNESKTTCEDM